MFFFTNLNNAELQLSLFVSAQCEFLKGCINPKVNDFLSLSKGTCNLQLMLKPKTHQNQSFDIST